MPAAAATSSTIFGLSTEIIGIWVAALLTLAIYSFLYADNPVYKVAEHIFVGISAAYGAVILYYQALLPKLVKPLIIPLIDRVWHPELADATSPRYTLLVPMFLGLLIFSRFVPRYDWLSRWPIAFVMGLYAGLSIPRSVQEIILKQMHGTMLPLLPRGANGGYDFLTGFSNLLLVMGVICTLAYFYFSARHEGLLGRVSRVGVWFLMVAFGAGFGNTVMARISLLIGRVQFLLYDWLPTIGIHLGGPGMG